ncbi:MAG: hypothetical protein M3N25_03070 [Actinomycetota bacterium]|nr:hypothetical protein [Actinomycetota bacterium]
MSDAVVAAIVGAVGVVLAALISRSDRRADTRYENLSRTLDSVHKTLSGQIVEVEGRLSTIDAEVRFGHQEVTQRIDRLYELLAGRATSSPEDRPAPPPRPAELAELAKAMRRRGRAAGRKPSS